MTVIQEKIVGAVDEAGGSIGWNALMEALDYREQQRALPEIRVLEFQKVLTRVVTRNPETGAMVFTINRFVEEVVEETPTE